MAYTSSAAGHILAVFWGRRWPSDKGAEGVRVVDCNKCKLF
jgi:hypothetical protein